MRSSSSPASRKQLASSMPSSTRGGNVGERDDAQQLASPAAFSASASPATRRTASREGRVAPHRPAAAPTKAATARLAQQRQQDPLHNVSSQKTERKTGLKSSTPGALAARDTAATATAAATHGRSAAATGGAALVEPASNTPFPFHVYPSTVVFDSYVANTTYTAMLELRNHTAFNKHVRIDRPNACTAFELTPPRGAESSSKVAPGLTVSYTVVFTPTSSSKDYEVDLVVRTEEDEPLIVPVRAYASRGCLQLPSALALKEAPIKGSSATPLFLRNISERSCIWRAVIFDPTSTATGEAAFRGVGESGASVDDCATSSCFSLTPRNGTVEPLCAAGTQAVTVAPVTLHFRPHSGMPAAGTCHGLLRFFLGPEGDVVQDVRLSARAVELSGIVLEESEVTLADTYVTTERQAVVRVRNDSDETIFFAWKNAFRDSAIRGDSDDEAEGGARLHCRANPDATAAHHRFLSNDSSGNDYYDHTNTFNGNSPEGGQQAESDLYEGDESFQIQPLTGVLYGRGVREFTITFNPRLAIPYESVAYLDVTGSIKRLPLILRGHGVGPQCTLEFNRLDIGDVYLNAVHEYFVTMENTSAIECQYIMMPPAPLVAASSGAEPVTPGIDFASKFHFTPSHGALAPGEHVRLRIELKSDRIGSFAETFHVHMQGAVEEVPLLLKGRVLGPHFQCDVDELDFGNVSYNMKHVRTMNIENTSPIQMHYALHLPDDCAYASDFEITPAEGVIAPRSAEAVEVHFCSRTVGDYETALLVEVADVGDVLDAIPLKATCMVPTLHSSTTELTFGGVFVGYPTTLNVAISNDTALTGMFELRLLNSEALTDIVMVELPVSAEHDGGVHWISPHQTVQLPVTLTALKPGRLHFSLALHVLGRDVSEPAAPPLTILVSAVASGPHVELQPSSVQFGTLDVLTEEVRELTLKNTSPVPAVFALVFDRYGAVSASADGAGSALGSVDESLLTTTLPFPRVPVFSVDPAEGVLEPHSSLTVSVRAKPDDAIAFADTLRLRRTLTHSTEDNSAGTIAEADSAASLESDVAITVKVAGQGVPIIADRPLESIDLGDVLTTTPVVETVTLHNYGRRDQEVQWQNTRGTKVKEGESPITFNYRPERATIPAGGSAVFTLCGSSADVGSRMDTFTLKQSGTFKEVLRSTVKASFIAPTLSCSTRAMVFDYANTTASAAAPTLVKSVTMKNITSKSLVIALRIKSGNGAATTGKAASTAGSLKDTPFCLEGPATVTLHSGESYVVGVRCNPLYRGDYTSHTVKAKLQLAFADHDRKEFVALTAALHFPAVVATPSSAVDFGTVLTNTEQRRSIELYNPSHDLPATFCWSLRPPERSTTAQADDGTLTATPTNSRRVADDAGDASASPAKAARLSSSSTGVPLTKTNGFDIIPFAGTLLPGETKVIEVAFQGADMGAALATAVCHVEGGPTYTIDLRAAANIVQAHCDKSNIDFGRLPYYESASRMVTLTNTTQVHVPWQVDLSHVRHPECLKISPMSGVLRDKARLQITFSPKVPDVFSEEIWVRIGHLDPRPIHVRGSGYMCSLAIATTVPYDASGCNAVADGVGGGVGGGGSQNITQVSRAPFTAFTEALQLVEAAAESAAAHLLPASSDAATASTPAELPAVLQKEWAVLEAERLAFCRAIREKASSAAGGDGTVTDKAGGATKMPLFFEPRTIRRNSATAQSSSGSSTAKLVLARYIVDFGHLTRHDVRKVKLTVANPSSEGVNVVFDNKEFANLPISVEPVKGLKVAARETTTIEVTMDATKPESMVPHGENAHEFTLDIKNGPAVVVECRCYVATPILKAKEREVHFGAVLLGEVKVLSLVLTNPEAVACPWRVTCKDLLEGDAGQHGRQSSRIEVRDSEAGRAAAGLDEKGGGRSGRRGEAGNGADETGDGPVPEFWVKQDRGVVPASGSLTIEVYYAPDSLRARNSVSAEKAATASVGQLKFRCGAGVASTVVTVKLSGSARQHQLQLSTEQLRLPPARPHQVLHESVTLTNNEDYAVEVFNIAQDPRHATEKTLIGRALEGSASHEVFLPHIQAGDYLPDALLESVFSELHRNSDALTEVRPVQVDAVLATAGGETSGGAEADGGNGGGKGRAKLRGSVSGATSAKGGARGTRKESRRPSAKTAAGDASAGQGGGANALLTGEGEGMNANNGEVNGGVRPGLLMLVGPPRSGKSSVAQQWLSQRDSTTILVDLDALIREEAERDDTANAAVARCLLTRAAEEDASIAAAVAAAPNAAASPVLPGSTPAAAKESKAPDSYLACIPTLLRDLLQSFLTNSISDHRSNAAVAAASRPGSAAPKTSAADSALATPMRFVVDGLTCGVLANQWALYELICDVCASLRVPVHVVSLHVSTPMSNLRAARALALHHEARVTAASLTPLAETAYEALSKEEREEYNRRLKYMNDCRRDLQAAQQQQRSWSAQLPHAAVQEELEDGARQQQAEVALEPTARPGKAQKGAPARRASEDRTAGQGEPDWNALDEAARFTAWYKRFLQKNGCPPSAEEKAAAAAAPPASGSAPASVKTGGSARSAGAAAGASGPAAGAVAQNTNAGWSSVLRINAETEEVESVAKDITHRLSQESRPSDNGSADVSGKATDKPASNGTASSQRAAAAASQAQTKLSSETFASRLGEWFYVNGARLRSWDVESVAGSRLNSFSPLGRGREGSGGETSVAATDGASGETFPNPAISGAARAGRDNVEAAAGTNTAHRYVRFFSTMEREVVQAKKPNSKKKSVTAVVLQKEEVTRWTLPARSSITLTLEFCSDHVGKFAERCVFGVLGSLQQVCLTVSAPVALPDISRDAKDIFPVVKPRIGAGGGGAAGGARRMPKVYIASKKLFDFGALLIAPPPTAKGRRRSGGAEKISPSSSTAGPGSIADNAVADPNAHNSPFEETLSFVNREPAEAEVTLSFANDKEKTFTVMPSTFTLQPGATQRVQLRATPDRVGEFTNTLVASIKENPVLWKAEVTCTGARPTLSVNAVKEALEVDFGRLVLRRSLVKSFTLANEGAIPLYWRLVPMSEASNRGGQGSGGGAAAANASLNVTSHWPAELQCSMMEGVLEEHEVQTMEMTFAPTHPCLHSRTLNFLVSEVGQPHTTYETIPMTVKAEGYDVVVEWTRELQLGVLHVGEEKRDSIRIMNKCPYDIGYQLRMPKRLQKVLTISTPSGTLRGMMGHKDAAIATIDVVARLDKEGELPSKLSVIEIAFFDVEKQELLYPLQSIPVSGEAWYTKYVVTPPSVSFGSCMVGQPRERTFELANTGRFPLEFSLFDYREAATAAATGSNAAVGSTAGGGGVDAAAHAAAGRPDSSSGQRRSLKSLKGIDVDFVVGAFTCRPGQGTVPVGGTQVITMSTVPSQQNRTHETIGVRVAQSGPELERYGTPVEVSAYPAAPSIAADLTSSADVETIFEEQRVVYRLDQLPRGARAYSKEERLFSFGTALVGQRCEERFRIANSSPLACSVTVQLEGLSNSGSGGGGGGAGGGGAPGTGHGRKSIGSGGVNGAKDGSTLDGFDLSVGGKDVSQALAKASAVKFTLPPFESRFITVGFTPASLCRLQGQLVATVDSGAALGEERGEFGQQLRFGLCGEGTLPTVELELPRRWASSDTGRSRFSISGTGEHMRGSDGLANGDKKKNARRRQGAGSMSTTTLQGEGHVVGTGSAEVLELPLTRLGATTSRSFTVRNTGCVSAKVHLRLLPNGTGEDAGGSSTSLSMRSGVIKGQPLQGAVELCRALEMVVPAGQSEVVEVTYTPTQVESTSTLLRLTLADNPFEDKEVHVTARSFKSAISFEGIDPASADFIDVGDCYLGLDKTCTFRARNNTDSLVRYVWEAPESVHITPSVGHLPSGAERTFSATLHSAAEGLNQRVFCALHAQSIIVTQSTGAAAGTGMPGATNTTGSAAAASSEWDNSLRSPKWVLREDDAEVHPNAAAYLSAAAAMMGRRNLKQVMEAVPEPAYSVTQDVMATQPLTMAYRSSVPTYQCYLVGGAAPGGTAGDSSAAGALKELKAISFTHTYLLQKRVATVRITNTGSVALPYSCSVSAGAAISSGGDAAHDPAMAMIGSSAPSPSWTAAQLSAAAASVAGGSGEDGVTGEPASDASPTADFSVASSSWSPTDAASSDVHLVDAGAQADLSVAFTPRTAGLLTAELILHFPHSAPREVQVPLQGVAECPLVHFKVPPAALRRSAVAQPPLLGSGAAGKSPEQQEPVVVEFVARGLHTKATVRLPVVNPTSGSYSYEWIEEMGSASSAGAGSAGGKDAASGGGGAVNGGAMSPFRCLTSSGVIPAGRSTEAAFEFFADALGVHESRWSFRIPGRATVPFRLIGSVVEPNVYFHASKVDFEHVQVGTRVERSVVLENCDNVPHPFAWEKLSLEGTSTFLSVKPLRGTIAPRERLSVLLSFSPQEEMEYNVPLRCAIKKSSVPLSINVKGVGICVHDSLQVEPAAENAGGEIVSVLRGQPLTLDLDRVQVNATAERRLVLRNTGTHPFHYSVETPANPCVRFDGAEGSIQGGQSAVMKLQYTPTMEETLKQCRLIFRIEGGVAYKVSVRAVAYLPRLRLSLDRYDFGPRFIAAYNSALSTSSSETAPVDASRGVAGHSAGAAWQELHLTNAESESISVECGMAPQNTWCRLDCTSMVVRPRETARLKLLFAPTEARRYEDVLELSLNKVNSMRIPIVGEGVAPRVEVANPFAKLGTVRVGESRSVEVRLQCFSKIPTAVSFARAIDEDLQSKGIAIVLPGQSTSTASASAQATMVLKPKDTVTVTIVFTPTHRMSEFNREIKMRVCGVELPFVLVSGSCADAEVHLDTTHLEFRDVVIGATATRKVVILNSGDVAQKFSWANSLQQLKPPGEWSITPSTGFVRAHTELGCEVRYTPSAGNGAKKNSSGGASKRKTESTQSPSQTPRSSPPPPTLPASLRVLTLELDSAPAVSLSVDANAVTRPAATETVQFACRARESDVRTIEVQNTSDQPWTAEPVLDNALWSCSPLVTLKPLATTVVKLTYNPARPTRRAASISSPHGNAAAAAAAMEGIEKTRQSTAAAPASPSHQKDKGFFFIALPDGTGRCVALEGTAEPAGPAGPLQRYDAVAQTSLPLRFQVHNWSATSTMRFRREVEWTAGPNGESGEFVAQTAMRVLENDAEPPAPEKSGAASRPVNVNTNSTANHAAGTTKARGKAASIAGANAAVRSAIEVPPKSSREVTLTVTPLRDGVYRGVVRFVPVDKNGLPIYGEGMQQFFEVELKVQPAPAAAPTTVELRAAIREVASFNIPLTNPLPKPVEFTFKSSAADGGPSSSSALEGFTLPAPVVVAAQSRGKAAVVFFPLLAKKAPSTVQCTVTSPDLGASEVYVFRLATTTETAAAERATQVTCPLGQHVSFVLRFTHYAKANTEFGIRVGGELLGKTPSSFSRVGGSGGGQGSAVKVSGVHASATASSGNGAAGVVGPKGQEVQVEFSYEPSALGEERETIEFVSPVAGSYVFPVAATCTAPQRQGPYTTRAGQNLQLPFKNVFHEPVNITVSSDSPAFVPAKKTESVPAHKTANIVLQCKAEEDKDVVRGRVSVTCTAPGKGQQQPVEWVYYVEMTGGGERNGTGKQSGRKK